LRNRIILEKTFPEIRTIGGGDVAYSKNEHLLFGAIVVLSFPEMETVDIGTAHGKTPFPYIPGLLTFREGPILINAFQELKIRPDLMIKISSSIETLSPSFFPAPSITIYKSSKNRYSR
jgi:deoxyribonuclease V